MVSLQRVVGYSVVFLLLCISHSYPSTEQTHRKFFTIQTGSFTDGVRAIEEFNLISQRLYEDELDYLRIERIGEYYTVRLGRFKDKKTAEGFLKGVIDRLPDSIIVEAYIIEERIVKRHSPEIEKKVRTKEDYIKTVSGLVNKGDYDSAFKEIRTAMIEMESDPDLNAWYGAVLLKMNRAEESLPYLKKAVASSDKPDYHNALGYCFFFLNRFDKAVEEFNIALRLNPSHIDALTGLVITYVKMGKTDKARGVHDKLKRIDKGTSDRLLKIIAPSPN